MRIKILVLCIVCIACCALNVRAQQTGATQPPVQTTAPPVTSEQRVPLTEQAIAFDALGRTALAASLRTTALNATVDAPIRDVQLVVENRSQNFYNYVSGWATFYDAAGVRCGEGLFKLDALAPAESAGADTPGLRLTCAPSTWRIAATNLLTRTSDIAKPLEPIPPPDQTTPTPAPTATTTTTQAAPLFVNISVNGQTYRVPLGSTLEVPVNKKRATITVSASQQ